MVLMVLQEEMVKMDREARLEHQERLVWMEHLDPMVLLEQQGQMVHQDEMELMVSLACLVLPEIPEHLENRVHLAKMAWMV